jgi:hypothetical protein
MNQPALLIVRASLDAVRTALLSLGATAQDRRAVALDLGEDLLVLGYDRVDGVTTVAVGGSAEPMVTARWLAGQLADLDNPVELVLPPTAGSVSAQPLRAAPPRMRPAVAG